MNVIERWGFRIGDIITPDLTNPNFPIVYYNVTDEHSQSEIVNFIVGNDDYAIVKMIHTTNVNMKYYINHKFDIQLKYFKLFKPIDNRTPLSKFINDIYIQEKEKIK